MALELRALTDLATLDEARLLVHRVVVVYLIIRWLAAQDVNLCCLYVSLSQRGHIACCKGVCRDALRDLHVLSLVDAAELIDIASSLGRDYLRLLCQKVLAPHLGASRCLDKARSLRVFELLKARSYG